MAILSYCSNGDRISEAQIKSRYSRALKAKHAGKTVFICAACGARAEHNDHTIARARLKHIHKSELIYDPDCFEDSCSKCHREWEDFKSGDWIKHHNAERRLAYLKKHDPEGYTKRIELTQLHLNEETRLHNRKGSGIT